MTAATIEAHRIHFTHDEEPQITAVDLALKTSIEGGDIRLGDFADVGKWLDLFGLLAMVADIKPEAKIRNRIPKPLPGTLHAACAVISVEGTTPLLEITDANDGGGRIICRQPTKGELEAITLQLI